MATSKISTGDRYIIKAKSNSGTFNAAGSYSLAITPDTVDGYTLLKSVFIGIRNSVDWQSYISNVYPSGTGGVRFTISRDATVTIDFVCIYVKS